jgi:hypothetical protein
MILLLVTEAFNAVGTEKGNGNELSTKLNPGVSHVMFETFVIPPDTLL